MIEVAKIVLHEASEPALGVYAMTTLSSGGAEDCGVASRVFGYLSGGEAVTEYTLTNRNGMIVKILDYGGIITELHVPDRRGQLADVVLGFDELAAYEKQHLYIGAIVGRCAGRIANGRFSLNSIDVCLATNDDDNHLHGGVRGFDKVIWAAAIGETPGQLNLSYCSFDGEEGYPGNLVVQVTYTLTDDGELHVEYVATTDSPTVVNLTQHSYFNLSGDLGSDILSHHLQVEADDILELDDSSIPTGIFLPVSDSPFDFRVAKPIGKDIDKDDSQLRIGEGYDHYWVLSNDCESAAPVHAISLEDKQSGRRMEVLTTQPGVQIYTGNYLDGALIGKKNQEYRPRGAICLETQNFPDAPNHSEFQSTRLEPGEQFHSVTVFRFEAS